MPRTAAALALLMAAGCSAPKHHFSGFLEDYSKLAPSSLKAGVLVYKNPDADFSRYDKIHVQPVSVHFANPKDEAAVSAQRLDAYKQMVQDALRDGLADHDLDAPQPGDHVAELRFQVANVRRTRMIESPRRYYGGHRYLLGSANVEAVLVDGSSGAVLAMHVGNTMAPEEIETWSAQEAWASLEAHTRRAIDRWVASWAPTFAAASRSAHSPSNEEDVR